VRDTVTISRLESYDYYFDYVIQMAERLYEGLPNPDLQSIGETAASTETAE
jgi:hypothetical protein